MSYVVFLAIVRFVDIGGTVDHHCFKPNPQPSDNWISNYNTDMNKQ
jgi:hypothetical protein